MYYQIAKYQDKYKYIRVNRIMFGCIMKWPSHNWSGMFDNVIFEVKLTFEMLTVRGQQHSSSTPERMFLWKCQSFWDRKCLDLRGTRTPTFGFMPNALTIWAIRSRHLLSHVLNTGSSGIYIYFWSKVNISNVKCARATSFILDTRTDDNWLTSWSWKYRGPSQ